MTTSTSALSDFTPKELRKLRSMKNPYGIQKFLDAMPYHLEDTAWSPRKVLAEQSAHCLEGAIFAAAALRAEWISSAAAGFRGRPRHRPRDRHLSARRMLGRGRQIKLQRMPLARAGAPHAARTGAELFQRLLQPAAGAHAAALFSVRSI
jgi:hypothetical protein